MSHIQSRFHVPAIFLYAAGALLLVVGVSLRMAWYPVVTSDYTYFVSVWFATLASHAGLSAFAQPFSDYAPLYLYMLKLLTFIPVDSLTLSKTLSLIFDIMIAAVAVALARDRSRREYRSSELFMVFVLFLSIPTVMLNSSLWGQSDALYGAPILLCLYYILGNRPLPAALAFGLAISVKVQAIFFLPVVLGYLWGNRKTRIYLLLVPAVFVISVIPAMLAGGDPWYWPLIYLKQSGEYPYLSVSAPSVFAFVNGLPMSSIVQSLLFWLGISLACIWAVIVASLSRHIRQLHPMATVLLSLSSVLIIPYVLPRMHERYFFLADILACALVVFAPRRWYIAVIVVGASLLSYMPYLSSQVPILSAFNVDLRTPASMLLIAISIVLIGLRIALSPQPVPTRRGDVRDDSIIIRHSN